MQTARPPRARQYEFLLDGEVFPQEGIHILDDGESIDMTYLDPDKGLVHKLFPMPRPYVKLTAHTQPPLGEHTFEIRTVDGSCIAGKLQVVDERGERRMYIRERF